MWLNYYVCDVQNLFSTESNFNKSTKFIAHKISALYGTHISA